MQISYKYRDSRLYRGLRFLFGQTESIALRETRWGKFFFRLGIRYAAEAGAILAVFLIVYKSALISVLPEWLLGSAFVVLIVGLLFAQKDLLTVDKIDLWYLAFLVFSLISLIVAEISGLDGQMLILGWLLFLPFYLSYLLGKTLGVGLVLRIIAFLSVPSALLGIYQVVSGFDTPKTWVSSFETGIATRAFGTFENPNVFGMFMVIASIAAVVLFLKTKHKLYLAIGLLCSIAMVFSFSRTALIATAVSLLVLLLAYRPKWLLYSPAGLLIFLIPSVRNRLLAAFSPSYLADQVLDGRTWSIINGLHIFFQKPLFGTGPGSYGGQLASGYSSPVYNMGIQLGYVALYYTDNQYVELLVQTGLIGLCLFLAAFVSYIWLIFSKKETGLYWLAGLGVCITFLVCALFANVLEFGAIAIPTGLIMGSALSEG